MIKAARRAVLLLGGWLVLATGGAADAQRYAPAPVPAPVTDTRTVDSANSGTIGVISGGVDGTYIRIAADLASVLDDGDHLRVLPLIGKGSVQNISDILFLRGVDIGIVQSDVLAYIDRQKLYPNVQQRIDYIAKLYEEEVHVLARQDIKNLTDLAHQKVNVDVRGSGTATTASVLFDGLGIPVEVTNDDQNTALNKLQHGDIAAIVYVVGKPARLFAPLPAGSGLHFLAIPINQALIETYQPTQLRHADYPTLIDDGAAVDTVAVGAVMAVYNWAPNTERYRKVARFVDAFFTKFNQFQQPPHHPKWKDVNLAAQLPGWTRFPAAQEWLQREALAGTAGGAAQADFNVFLDRAGAVPGNLDDAQKASLFRQFLQWQSTRRAAAR